MSPRESDVNPFLQGNFAPWRMEGEAEDLEVEGEIPRELDGTWYRNGPNPAYEPSGRYHWFDGDGMIHAIRLRDGRASYRNRWVRSEGLIEERRAGKALYPGLLSLKPTEAPRFKVTGNTNIVFHAGKLLALVENSLPTELARCTLETIGLYDYTARLGGPMTAHPKIDPETGEMLFFGYSPFPPYLQYHVADREGVLVRSEPIDVAWPSMMHDFAITRSHVVFFVCPVVFDLGKLEAAGTVLHWEPDRGTRIGVMPRSGGNAEVRWFETDPCYLFHPMNAYDEDGAVVVDVARYEEFRFMSPVAARDPGWRDRSVARLHRWRIDLAGGVVRSRPLDDRSCEFPRVDERLVGRKHRYGYVAAAGPEQRDGSLPLWTAIEKHDVDGGKKEVRPFGEGNGASEPLFVPRQPDAAEDDGWLLVLVYDRNRNASDFLVLDARDIAGDPVARI
ncbi:MAG: carotenoid oxygenase family protein, partial [Candidatus Binatia bacterium]